MLSRLTLLAMMLCACGSVRATIPEIRLDAQCAGWIKLEGEIDKDLSNEFVQKLAACRDRAVLVEINSPGGDWFASLEMQKAIERHPHQVVCMVDGMAASAAFVTLQSCDIRVMTNRSMLMAHQAAVSVHGQETEVNNALDVARTIDHAIALRCSKRMRMPVAAYEAKVANGVEWWLGLESAVQNHAVDFEVSGVVDALALTKKGY